MPTVGLISFVTKAMFYNIVLLGFKVLDPTSRTQRVNVENDAANDLAKFASTRGASCSFKSGKHRLKVLVFCEDS